MICLDLVTLNSLDLEIHYIVCYENVSRYFPPFIHFNYLINVFLMRELKCENEMLRILKMFAQRQNEKKKGPIISFL